jgi:ATP-dependent DNA helicase RecQ
MNCSGERLPGELNSELVTRAVTFLRSDALVIEPRKMWPPAAIAQLSGRIPPLLQPRPGRALCIYGDAGWGREVARCKYAAGVFSEELVKASAELIASRWKPQPPPQWLTAVPSLRNPLPVYNFAERLASRLGIPFEPVLTKAKETPPQKTMENSSQQLRNVFGAFRLIRRIPKGPVLLVDDIVDSKWTLTVVAWLLLSNGSGPVLPFALASSSVGNN